LAFTIGFGSDPTSVILDIVVVLGIAVATFLGKRALRGGNRKVAF
jgi:hypothetical protein